MQKIPSYIYTFDTHVNCNMTSVKKQHKCLTFKKKMICRSRRICAQIIRTLCFNKEKVLHLICAIIFLGLIQVKYSSVIEKIHELHIFDLTNHISNDLGCK